MDILHIQLLGDFRLKHKDAILTTAFRGRLQSFFAYLLLHRQQSHTRQKLAFLFWPDSIEPQARNNLRQLLHHLRYALPNSEQYLAVTGDSVQWREEAPYYLDVEAFEVALARAASSAERNVPTLQRDALQVAVDVYKGDLLPGLYDEWVVTEREHLREAYLQALERLLQYAERQTDFPAAIAYARQLLRHDSLHEPTCRRLMRLLAVQGDHAGAIRLYDTFVARLFAELGVLPSPVTRELYLSLLQSLPPGTGAAQLSDESKRAFHLQAARALEEGYGAPSGADDEEIARHYEQAGKIVTAMVYYFRAALYAELNDQRSRALSLATHALSLVSPTAEPPETGSDI